MDTAKHPIQVVEQLLARYHGNMLFEFSRYIYTPQQLFDMRAAFQVNGHEISENWLTDILDSLSPDEELALHSKVSRRGKTFHIPMIDFVSRYWSAGLETAMRKYLPRNVVKDLMVFSSGRSYHAYSLLLLEPGQWHEFMGRLLLMNSPTKHDVIDTRWVGHRIIGGFSSLRWSCNTAQYWRYPELVEPSKRLGVISNAYG